MSNSLLNLSLGEEAEPGHVGVQAVDVDVENVEIRVTAWGGRYNITISAGSKAAPTAELTCG
jgi:hypothetical protein